MNKKKEKWIIFYAIKKIKDIKKIKKKNFKNKINLLLFKYIKKKFSKKKKFNINKIKNKNIKKYIKKILKIKKKNIKKYIKNIKKKNIKKKLYSILKKNIKLIKKKNIKINNFIEKINKKINRLKILKKKNPFSIKNEIKKIYKNLKNKNKKKEYIKTGFKKLDKIILGFYPGDLIIIAGKPSSGKTSFCLNICNILSIKKKIPSLLYSLEMTKEQILIRLLSITSKVRIKKIKKKNLKKKDLKKIKKSYKKIKKSKMLIEDTFLNINKIRKAIKSMKNIKVIIIDYLQLIFIKNYKENRNNEIAKISRTLKEIAKEFKIVIIALSQLNRSSNLRLNKRPIMSDLKDSGSIEQDADLILFLYKEEYYKNIEKKNEKIEIIIGKNRNGQTGIIKLKFIKNKTKFKEYNEI